MTEPIKDPEQVSVEKMKNAHGTTFVMLRDKKTKRFLKNTKRNMRIGIQQVMEATAQKITRVNPETGTSDIENMIDSMILLANNPTEKTANASVKAFEAVKELAFGQAPKSDLDRAETTQRVKVVIVVPPELMDKTVYEEKPRPALVPAFIDAEIVSTNPQVALVKTQPAPRPAPHTSPAAKELVQVSWLSNNPHNDSLLEAETKGLSVSTIKERAAHQRLPLKITKVGNVLQGIIHLADAVCRGQETIAVEVEQ